MKKVEITFNSAMTKNDVIIVVAGDNSAAFTGVSSLTGGVGEFLLGASPVESAKNFYNALSSYTATTPALGPTHVDVSGTSVEATFLSSSVTTASASFYGSTSPISTSVTDRNEDYYNYEKQILTRSPHYYSVEDPDGDSIDSAELHIFIYQGSRHTDRPFSPTYVVRSSATLSDADKMTFNISEFARSYSESTIAASGNPANWTPFMDIFPYYTKGGSTYSLQPSLGIAYNGYGYFEEGTNPSIETALAQSNNTVIAHDDYGFALPINAEKAVKIVFERDNEVVKVNNIPSDVTYSSAGLPNYSIGAGIEIPARYDFSDTEYFENLYLSEYLFNYSDTRADKVYIERTDGYIEVVDIRYIKECKYEPINLTFVNKFGAFQSVVFFKNHSVSMKTKEESFRRNTLGGVNVLNSSEGEYLTTQHQYKNLYKSAKQSISLNSGFYPEEYNEVFRQMMISNDCWIAYNGKVLPVNISDSDIRYKTSINDKLIEYSIKCDFAFDTINSIN